jgi:hypothetical protein
MAYLLEFKNALPCPLIANPPAFILLIGPRLMLAGDISCPGKLKAKGLPVVPPPAPGLDPVRFLAVKCLCWLHCLEFFLLELLVGTISLGVFCISWFWWALLAT